MPRGLLLIAWLVALLATAAGPAIAQSAAQARDQGQKCLAARDFACAEKAFATLVRLRPTDPTGYALRGITLVRMERYRAAIADLEKAMDMGEGTWDILAYYAEALRYDGRVPEAIDWSYRTLTVVATLVDVRGELATMLVAEGRHHEALAVLAAFDAQHVQKGKRAYFTAQRLAIERALLRRGAQPAAPPPPLRLSKTERFFYAPVELGEAGFSGFMIDTGASTLVLPRAMLAESRAQHRVERRGVKSRLADGRSVEGDMVRIARIGVGPFALAEVQAFVCDRCAPLLGQEVLSQFDMRSSRVVGVEFMTLTQRTPLVR